MAFIYIYMVCVCVRARVCVRVFIYLFIEGDVSLKYVRANSETIGKI